MPTKHAGRALPILTSDDDNDARQGAAAALAALLDERFLKALAEPARIDLLRVLLIDGRADVAGIAQKLPQDRSVISRHLGALHAAGLVVMKKEGRHRFYELDGAAFVEKLGRLYEGAKALVSICCPPSPPSSSSPPSQSSSSSSSSSSSPSSPRTSPLSPRSRSAQRRGSP